MSIGLKHAAGSPWNVALISIITLSMLFAVVAVVASPTTGSSGTSGAPIAVPGPAPPAACGQVPVPLGSAAAYAVLAGATVTNTGPTSLTGDLGLSPGTAVTGFPPGTLTGIENIGNPLAAQAEANLTIAYHNASPAVRANCPVTLTDGENLAGLTLTPGLYFSASTLNIEGGDLTLSGGGNPNGVFVFQIGSSFTTTSGAAVILSDGAQAGNVFWQVGSSATLGTTSTMQGTLLAASSISMLTGSVLNGRALAETGEVSMEDSTIVVPTTVFSTNYTVTFTESGLPTGTHWSVTLNGVLSNSTTSTIEFSVVNGTYAYTIGTVAGYTANPLSGSVTVNGAAVGRAVTFTSGPPGPFAVTFTESGLPSGTSWSVALNGITNSSQTTTIVFSMPNGTYAYTVRTAAAYTAHPSSGSVTVQGLSIGQAITFRAGTPSTYTVTFTESGLTSGTNWSVTLNGAANSSTTTTVGFFVQNGTYAYIIGSIAGYFPTPTSGSVSVSGASSAISIAFASIGPGNYVVTFTESGLATGASWSVTLGVIVKTSVGPTIGFIEANGSYAYTVGVVAGFSASPASGTATVSGAPAGIAVTFTAGAPSTYAVTFTESGLASGASWAVTLNGVLQSSTTTSIAFSVANQTYAYSVGTVAHFTASPSSGTLTVNGSAVEIAVTFTAVSGQTFAVAFTESGLAPGTSWGVIFAGNLKTSTTPAIGFVVANGSYAYTVNAIPGFTAIPSSGSVTVNGAPTGAAIAFTNGAYAVTLTASPSTGLTVNSVVTFTVTVQSSGSIPSGTATIYIGTSTGLIRAEWEVTPAAGAQPGTPLTVIPGLVLSPGSAAFTFWATFLGSSSAVGTLSLNSMVAPTTLTLSVSTTGAGISTFSIASNGAEETVTLSAYGPSGQLIGLFTVALGASGSGSIVLKFADLGFQTSWVVTFGAVTSNHVIVG